MTRKDYELIAQVIKAQREKMHNETETVDEVAQAMCEALEDENPNFNRETFFRACGINPIFTERMFTPAGQFINN